MTVNRLFISLAVLLIVGVAAFLADEINTQRLGGPTVYCKVTYLEVLSSHGTRSDGGSPVRSVSNVEINCAGRNYVFVQFKDTPALDYAQWQLLELGQLLKGTMTGPSFVAKLMGGDPMLTRLRAP